MTRIFNTSLLALLLAVTLVTGVETVDAGKSITVTKDKLPTLNYFYNFSGGYTTDTVPLSPNPVCDPGAVDLGTKSACGWTKGLDRDSVVNVTYKAKLINLETNQEITDRATVPVGTRFKVIRDTSTENTDISWNGTGWSTDSPFGNWVVGAGSKNNACHTEDYVNTAFMANSASLFLAAGGVFDFEQLGTYILFNVNPPTPVVVNPSANLSCSGANCTVNGAGAVSVGLQFPVTSGKFYYRYKWIGLTANPGQSADFYAWMKSGCHANNVPMRRGDLSVGSQGNVVLDGWDALNAKASTYSYGGSCSGIKCLPAEREYTLPIPLRTITFGLTAVTPNSPPTAPTVNPNPLSGTTRTSYSITLTTSDPDAGDRIRFGIDWNNDGTTDQYQPSPGFSASMNQTVPRTWNTPGAYTYKVRAEDNNGGVSGWTTAIAHITLPVPTGLTATPNATCGSKQINVSWNSVPEATSYTLRDGATDLATGPGTSYNHINLISGSSHSYTVRANSAGGNSTYSSVVTQNAPADCGAPNLSTLTAPNCTIAVGAGTCTTPVSWTVLKPVSPRVMQNGATIATTPTGASVSSGPIHFGSDPQNTVTVTDTNGQLGIITPEGACVLGALWDGSVCAHANITSGTITTANPLTQNTDVTFGAPVTNTGTVSTGNAFRDEFSYQWGVTTGTWKSISTVNNGVMNPLETRTDTSGSFTLVNSGTLHVRHCVDVTNLITETDESNCTVTSLAVAVPVVGTPEATLVAPSCDIAKGSDKCDTTVTWTSRNISTPSITRDGAEISNHSNDNAPQTITYTDSPVTFTFSDGTTDLVTVITGAGCARGLVWDGDSCELPAKGTINADPQLIPRGGITKITWSTENVTNCTVRGGVDSWTGTADTKTSSALVADTTYVLACDGRALGSVFVDVQGPDINVSSRIVPKVNDPVTVTWNPWGVPGCVVNGGGLVNVVASVPGSQPGVQIKGATVFTLTCGSVVEDRVRVELVGTGFET